MTYRLQYVCCGKRRCGMCGGRSYAHGPYWYRFWKEGRRTRSAYVGKTHPDGRSASDEEQRQARAEAREKTRHREEHQQPKRRGETGPSAADWALFGLRPGVGWLEIKRTHRRLAKEHHPDRGGKVVNMQRVNAAWDRFRVAFGR